MRTFKAIPLVLVLSLSIFLISCSENNPSNPSDNFQTFQKTFDNGFDDVGMDVLQLENGDFVLAGYAKSQDDPGANSYIIHLNKNGETIWSNAYTEDVEQYCTNIVQTDNGFIFGGSKGFWFNGEGHFYLTKIDADGNKIWHHTIADDVTILSGAKLIRSGPGGFIIAGEYGSGSNNTTGLLFVRIDAEGNEIERFTQDIGDPVTFDFCESGDGNYVITYRIGNHNTIITRKINSNGEILWQHQHESETYILYMNDIIQRSDGGYLITGSASSDDSFLVLVALNAEGEEEWFNIYDTLPFESGNDIKETRDGNFILTGRVAPDNLLLLKIDQSGNSLWYKQYTSKEASWGANVIETLDGGFAAVGVTFGQGLNVADMYFVKTDPNGNVY